MKIGLIDVDGHHYPNLALMRISAYHKSICDDVEWCFPMYHYDIVYQSKIFSDQYSPDIDWIPNADKIFKGGTGYAIKLENGVEVYDKEKDQKLPNYIEKMFPDYSIYPQFHQAICMTSRGCPRGCQFCHVAAKEGRCSVKVADVSDFWNGQKEIDILDPNILACKDKRDLMAQYRETNAILDFNQGLDIRLINDSDMDDINHMRIKYLHFAWDNSKDNLEPKFKYFKDNFKRKTHIGIVYCLVGFNSTMEENLYRVYTLRDLGFDPYVMVYNKPNADKELLRLQRWVNSKFIFKSCKRFEDYTG